MSEDINNRLDSIDDKLDSIIDRLDMSVLWPTCSYDNSSDLDLQQLKQLKEKLEKSLKEFDKKLEEADVNANVR